MKKQIMNCMTGEVSIVDMTADETTAYQAEQTQSAIEAPVIALAVAKSNAGDRIDNTNDVLRALVLLLLDELNLHATTTDAILTAAISATNLADFKNKMGQITAIPQRTVQQLRTAILNKLGT